MKQWHLMWADNFTVAPFIIFFDVDSIPVLPMRCHDLFDQNERPLWHTWIKGKRSPWVQPCAAVFRRLANLSDAGMRTRLSPVQWHLLDYTDFSSYFPMVVPRELLVATRAVLARAFDSSFEEAFTSRMR
eukprot:2224716-Prymnesium_polylepis.2